MCLRNHHYKIWSFRKTHMKKRSRTAIQDGGKRDPLHMDGAVTAGWKCSRYVQRITGQERQSAVSSFQNFSLFNRSMNSLGGLFFYINWRSGLWGCFLTWLFAWFFIAAAWNMMLCFLSGFRTQTESALLFSGKLLVWKIKDKQFGVAPPAGIEPATYGLTVRRSTDWTKEEHSTRYIVRF